MINTNLIHRDDTTIIKIGENIGGYSGRIIYNDPSLDISVSLCHGNCDTNRGKRILEFDLPQNLLQIYITDEEIITTILNEPKSSWVFLAIKTIMRELSPIQFMRLMSETNNAMLEKGKCQGQKDKLKEIKSVLGI